MTHMNDDGILVFESEEENKIVTEKIREIQKYCLEKKKYLDKYLGEYECKIIMSFQEKNLKGVRDG